MGSRATAVWQSRGGGRKAGGAEPPGLNNRESRLVPPEKHVMPCLSSLLNQAPGVNAGEEKIQGHAGT